MSECKIDGFNKSLEGEQKWPPSFVKIELFDFSDYNVNIKHICVQHLEKPIIGQKKVEQ